MINLDGIEHVWECSPDVLHNEGRDLTVKVKLASFPDIQKQTLAESQLDIEGAWESQSEFIGKHVVGIEGLKIKGEAVTTFEQLMKTGVYHELIKWFKIAVLSERVLTRDKIKNSVPESSTDS
jgi:hypothetical protein